MANFGPGTGQELPEGHNALREYCAKLQEALNEVLRKSVIQSGVFQTPGINQSYIINVGGDGQPAAGSGGSGGDPRSRQAAEDMTMDERGCLKRKADGQDAGTGIGAGEVADNAGGNSSTGGHREHVSDQGMQPHPRGEEEQQSGAEPGAIRRASLDHAGPTTEHSKDEHGAVSNHVPGAGKGNSRDGQQEGKQGAGRWKLVDKERDPEKKIGVEMDESHIIDTGPGKSTRSKSHAGLSQHSAVVAPQAPAAPTKGRGKGRGRGGMSPHEGGSRTEVKQGSRRASQVSTSQQPAALPRKSSVGGKRKGDKSAVATAAQSEGSSMPPPRTATSPQNTDNQERTEVSSVSSSDRPLKRKYDPKHSNRTAGAKWQSRQRQLRALAQHYGLERNSTAAQQILRDAEVETAMRAIMSEDDEEEEEEEEEETDLDSDDHEDVKGDNEEAKDNGSPRKRRKTSQAGQDQLVRGPEVPSQYMMSHPSPGYVAPEPTAEDLESMQAQIAQAERELARKYTTRSATEGKEVTAVTSQVLYNSDQATSQGSATSPMFPPGSTFGNFTIADPKRDASLQGLATPVRRAVEALILMSTSVHPNENDQPLTRPATATTSGPPDSSLDASMRDESAPRHQPAGSGGNVSGNQRSRDSKRDLLGMSFPRYATQGRDG